MDQKLALYQGLLVILAAILIVISVIKNYKNNEAKKIRAQIIAVIGNRSTLYIIVRESDGGYFSYEYEGLFFYNRDWKKAQRYGSYEYALQVARNMGFNAITKGLPIEVVEF